MNGRRLTVTIMAMVAASFAITILFSEPQGIRAEEDGKSPARKKKKATKEPKATKPGNPAKTNIAATNAELLKRLGEKIPKITAEDTDFSDMLDHIRKIAGINIHARWGVLEAAGIGMDSTISLQLANVTLENMIKKVLEATGGGTVELDFFIEDNILTISTKDDLSQRTGPPRLYDIRELLIDIPNYLPPTNPALQRTWGRRDYSLSCPPSSDDYSLCREEMSQRIREVVTNTVDPCSWYPTGCIGSIEETINGNLLITQIEENHEEIEKLLDLLQDQIIENVLVSTRWVEADTEKIDKILKESKAKKKVPLPITDAQLKEIGAKTIFCGQLRCANNQRTYIASGPGETYVAGLEPIISASVVANKPITAVAQWGPILDIQTTLGMKRKTAIVTLTSSMTKKTKETNILYGKTEANPTNKRSTSKAGDTLQLFEFDTQNFSTTLRIPLDTPVIVGGMTTPNMDSSKVLYLIVELSTDKPAQEEKK